jgi:CRP/FNR family cyclic AMP-dependent transcriptional regulator
VSAEVDGLLAVHPLLAGLPEGATSMLAACARLETFDAGETLFREGKPADALYLIGEGSVAIEVFGPTKGPLVVDTVGPGGVVGLSWVSPPFRWQFDARARTDVVAAVLDRECLRERLDADPAIGYALLDRLSGVLLHRLQATRIRLLDLYGTETFWSHEADHR